ncbi:hypothetical protein M1316_02105 [Candidatus Parvarchaeota archaeon]|nr:hypothetical protein [Candidatus Parvarchaeota archaeon]
MRRFILYSRTGQTAPFVGSLMDAGRLDIVYQCIFTSMFASHAIRRDTEFHAFLYGAPIPPVHVAVDGKTLHDVRIDENTWRSILNNLLAGKDHPGISSKKEGIEGFSKDLSETYVLSEKGDPIEELKFSSPSFFVGDNVGLPKKFEDLLLKNGAKKVSIGQERYLAASTIDIVNYILDKKRI